MAAALIDGRAFAEKLRARVAAAVPDFVARAGRQPGLATVLVGEDPASEVYVRAKGKARSPRAWRASKDAFRRLARRSWSGSSAI